MRNSRRAYAAITLLLLAATSVQAAELPLRPLTLVDLSASANRQVPNDLGVAQIYAEQSGNSAAEVASAVNTRINGGLRLAREQAGFKVHTQGISTRPNYGKNGRIDSWVVRSDFTVESPDLKALSEVVGKLQNSLSVAYLRVIPSTETRRKAEEEATIDAIAAFRSKADRVARSLGKPYEIKHLTVNEAGGVAPAPRVMMRAASMAEAVAPDVEAGESQVVVTITGQIELPR